MQRYIQNQIQLLNSLDQTNPAFDAEEVGHDLRQAIRDVELKASTEARPEIVEACQMREGPISIGLARLILTRCLALADDKPTTDWLLVSEVASLLRVSESKVLAWINSEQLVAKNVSNSDRPQYRIHVENLQQLNTSTPETGKRRRRKPATAKDYFSDL